MNPEHPNNAGIGVSEETLKNPERLKELEKTAKQAADALNNNMSKPSE